MLTPQPNDPHKGGRRITKLFKQKATIFEKETPGGPEFWCLRAVRCSVAAASASALGCERLELQISRVSVDVASLLRLWMLYFSVEFLAWGTPRLHGGLCHQSAGWRLAGCASLDACCAERHFRIFKNSSRNEAPQGGPFWTRSPRKVSRRRQNIGARRAKIATLKKHQKTICFCGCARKGGGTKRKTHE